MEKFSNDGKASREQEEAYKHTHEEHVSDDAYGLKNLEAWKPRPVVVHLRRSIPTCPRLSVARPATPLLRGPTLLGKTV